MFNVVARKFNTLEEVNLFLTGGVIFSPPDLKSINDRVYGLVGKKITFLHPAVAVTFAAGAQADDPSALTIADIRAQLAAALTGTKVIQLSGHLRWAIVETTPSAGIQVDSNLANTDADAVAKIGLSLTATGIVRNFLQAYPFEASHVVYTVE
jgi:hypothetical protein